MGPLIIVIVLVVAIPVAVLVSGAVAAAILGWGLTSDAESRNEGTEYVALGN
ncbi:MAG: hypothetical protein MUF83_04060 [Acidimicrobiales bacterium]|nr:hypothetical protein [Acidimicrobiales bacterium]